MADKRQATLTDWAVVRYPEIYAVLDDPAPAYARFGDGCEVVLLGKAVNDSRYDAGTGEFSDGHRLLTSQIVKVDGNKYHTQNTIYTLADEDMCTEYRKWCKNNP